MKKWWRRIKILQIRADFLWLNGNLLKANFTRELKSRARERKRFPDAKMQRVQWDLSRMAKKPREPFVAFSTGESFRLWARHVWKCPKGCLVVQGCILILFNRAINWNNNINIQHKNVLNQTIQSNSYMHSRNSRQNQQNKQLLMNF